MSDIEKIISLAREQIGVSEQPPGSNNVLYNTVYYGGPVNGDQYPWCVTFIWWLFNVSGLASLFCGGQKTAYCPYVVNYARQNGLWITDGYRPGDLALYDWGGDKEADHIGLIVAVNGNALTTIEGNAGESVREMSRSAVTVMGAYRPVYAVEESAPPVEDEPLDGDVYVVKSGDSLWRIAEKFLGDPWKYPEIMQANGMTSDVIHPGLVLVIPGKKPEAAPQLVKFTAEVEPQTWELLRIMADGNHLTIGQVIDLLLEDAR